MRIRLAPFLLTSLLLGGCATDTSGLYGEDLFEASCAHCHRSDLTGDVGPALGPGSNVATLTDDQIIGVIRIGPGAMTSFGDRFTDAQLDSLVRFLRERQAP
ncbi:MAG: cytochrome c [Actinomycetota bacterium]